MITAVIFAQLPRTLTWISRKIIFPTRNIETRTCDFRPAYPRDIQLAPATSNLNPRYTTRDQRPSVKLL